MHLYAHSYKQIEYLNAKGVNSQLCCTANMMLRIVFTYEDFLFSIQLHISYIHVTCEINVHNSVLLRPATMVLQYHQRVVYTNVVLSLQPNTYA